MLMALPSCCYHRFSTLQDQFYSNCMLLSMVLFVMVYNVTIINEAAIMAKTSAPVTLSNKLTKAGIFNAGSQIVVYILGLLVTNASTVNSTLLKFGVPVLAVNLLLVVVKDIYDNRSTTSA